MQATISFLFEVLIWKPFYWLLWDFLRLLQKWICSFLLQERTSKIHLWMSLHVSVRLVVLFWFDANNKERKQGDLTWILLYDVLARWANIKFSPHHPPTFLSQVLLRKALTILWGKRGQQATTIIATSIHCWTTPVPFWQWGTKWKGIGGSLSKVNICNNRSYHGDSLEVERRAYKKISNK